MCGIAGVLYRDKRPVDDTILKRMVRTLTHRGPDDEGYYIDNSFGMGMRRLSIIDLAGGKQPIHNETQTIQVVFNGEIYNYQALRNQLQQKGHTFATNSDTEVIVHAYEEYGTACFTHFNGMFAIAIWDRTKQQLVLARDRLGIKPLYYSDQAASFVFGSEIKAILASDEVDRTIHPEALQAYLALRYVPAPLSIFKNIRKLPAACFAVVCADSMDIESYWDPDFTRISSLSESALIEQFGSLFDEAVQCRLISDVPLGAFLSGGIDSSAIVAAMTSYMSERPRTFTIGFHEGYYDERSFASLMADRLGTVHGEAVAEPNLVEFLDDYVYHFDEPFADQAAFPTYLLSKFTKERVTVALSGDGGDEIFAGYDRYWSEKMADIYVHLPRGLREGALNPLLDVLTHLFPENSHMRIRAEHAARKGRLSSLPAEERYLAHFNLFSEFPFRKILASSYCTETPDLAAADLLRPWMNKASSLDPLNQRLYTDMKTWLPEQMLTKIDRMSMAVSLEVRVPFLDYRLVEFAAAIPPAMKMNLFTLKKFLKKATRDRLPAEIRQRRKHGFQVPLNQWMRGALRPLLEEVLSSQVIAEQGLLQPEFVSDLMTQHQNGSHNHGEQLFSLLVLTRWYDRWGR